MRFFLRSKIHRATVTEANLDYVGSVTIDEELMELADIQEWEKVLAAVSRESPAPTVDARRKERRSIEILPDCS